MIVFKAICREHGWESSGLYKSRANARRSGNAHKNNSPKPHDVIILEVYIPSKAMQIRSENIL